MAMNRILHFLDVLKQKPYFQIFTIYLRYLVGSAFVIAAFGMGKFSNHPIGSSSGASLDSLMPIQQFFRVMADSGLYWNFIGWSQVIAGGLLMTQRFAKLGALIFFGIILNIFVITVSYGFQGTPVVTGLMLLATIYLLLWDLESLQYVVRRPKAQNLFNSSTLEIAGDSYWSYVGLIMFSSILILGSIKFNLLYQLGIGFAEGLSAFVLYFVAFRGRRIAAQ
jgi:hypothetical protein